MVRELYQRLREYFNNLPEPTEEERQFIRELNAGYCFYSNFCGSSVT